MKILPWILLAIAVIALVLLWFREPTENKLSVERERAYQTEIAILKAEKAKERAAKDSIKLSSKERTQRDSVALKALESKTRIAIQREKEALARIPKEELTPAVVRALAAKDTVIASVQAERDSLRGSLYDTGKEFIAFQEADIKEDKFTERLIAECEARREEMKSEFEKELKKEKKKGVVAKILIPVAAAAGLILGGL